MPTPSGEGSIEVGLLDPVTADTGVDDAAVLACLVTAEVALTRAWVEIGVAPPAAAQALDKVFPWNGAGRTCDAAIALDGLDVVTGGNPVIPLLPRLRQAVGPEAAWWVHRGATSQDIMDSALMLLARITGAGILEAVGGVVDQLARLARDHAGTLTAARTLTQHAVPTTVGARIAGWGRALARARTRLTHALEQLPAQLGGAGGNLAAFVQLAGADRAARLPVAYAAELGLAAPDAPWHTARWPVTELGDALTQTVDALGVLAGDIATLSRTEIGEVADSGAGGSSTMPQKQNPTRAVLIRSAAIRAPHLGAALHAAASAATDERPDGAWHAEWPVLRDLLRLAAGASSLAREMLTDLEIDTAATKRNLHLTGPLLLAERVALVLTPVLGPQRVQELIRRAGAGEDLRALLEQETGVQEAGIDPTDLLDPAAYTGLATELSAFEESEGEERKR